MSKSGNGITKKTVLRIAIALLALLVIAGGVGIVAKYAKEISLKGELKLNGDPGKAVTTESAELPADDPAGELETELPEGD